MCHIVGSLCPCIFPCLETTSMVSHGSSASGLPASPSTFFLSNPLTLWAGDGTCWGPFCSLLSLPVAYGSPGALWPRLLLLKHGQHLTSCLSVGSSTFYYYLLFKITLLVLRGCKFALNLSRIVLNWFFKYDHKLFIYFLQNSTLRGYKHDLFKNVSLFLDTKFVSILGL